MELVPKKEGAYVSVPKITTGADAPASTASSSSSMSSSSSSSMSSVEGDVATSSSSSRVSGDISAEELAALHALDLRVGKIISCERHPDADR